MEFEICKFCFNEKLADLHQSVIFILMITYNMLLFLLLI